MGLFLSPVFPNPSHGKFSYSVNLSQAQRVKVCVFDITGRLVETLIDKQLPAGAHNFTWIPKSELANGVYYLCLDADGEQQSRKFVILQ
jgi:flagellar hook assembly protein FlgD